MCLMSACTDSVCARAVSHACILACGGVRVRACKRQPWSEAMSEAVRRRVLLR